MNEVNGRDTLADKPPVARGAFVIATEALQGRAEESRRGVIVCMQQWFLRPLTFAQLLFNGGMP